MTIPTYAFTQSSLIPQSGTRENTWAFGFGGLNVLDTYLSPQEYKGMSASVSYESERGLPWGRKQWSFSWQTSIAGGYLSSPTNDGREFDTDVIGGIAFMRNWNVESIRLAVGPSWTIGTGFTYNTRNGNNPAQGKLHTNIGISGKAEYRWTMLSKQFTASILAEMPIAGLMFTPNYGQSYYEIFSLGNYDKNVRFTNPFNSPNFHIQTTLGVKFGKVRVNLGYNCMIRQSNLNNLKAHSWNNQFTIGFTRNFKLL